MTNIDRAKRFAIVIKKFGRVLAVLMTAIVLILGLVQLLYKQTYSVVYKGEVIGYTKDKLELQKRINDTITSGDGKEVAFIDVQELPKYEACLLKKDVSSNDDEIYNKVINDGTKYYKYYAVTSSDEEKAYLQSFDEAQEVISKLKEKKSNNIDKIGIVEKYDVAKADYKDVDTCVNELYVKKPKPGPTYSSYKKIYSNERAYPTNLGVTLIKPVNAGITSRFGGRWGRMHKGIDIGAPKGTEIKAACAGKVIASGYTSGYGGYGKVVVVRATPNLVILYAHCNETIARVGDTVQQGQVIAKVGNTGRSFGNHLHFEIRYNGTAINPQAYVYK